MKILRTAVALLEVWEPVELVLDIWTPSGQPVLLMNAPVMTLDGNYRMQVIDTETAKRLIQLHGYTSAIGHEGTADVLSELLGVEVSMNRIKSTQRPGQLAVCLQLRDRQPEGVILTADVVKRIGYDLRLIARVA